jgi:putative cell wall-binding protein
VITRLWGNDRYATAIAVSRAQWQDGRAHAVVLARGDDFADALAGVPFAAHAHGPLLLTDPKVLDTSVENEIRRVLGDPAWGGTVHILGGDQAVSPVIAAKLAKDGYHVDRDAGNTRFGTALTIAESFNSGAEVMVATGNDYADALASGPLGAVRDAPLLLSDGSHMDTATAMFVSQHTVIDAVGGQAVAAIQNAGLRVANPLWGADRFGTSRAVAVAVEQTTGSKKAIGVASGLEFPDAVTGGAFSANAGMPLVLIEPQSASDSSLMFLHSWLPQLANVDVFGGPAAVSDTVVGQIKNTLHATLN